MNTVQKTPDQLAAEQAQDAETINKIIPSWARALNWAYEHTFGPLERFVESLRAAPTRQMIAEFEAAEARRARAS